MNTTSRYLLIFAGLLWGFGARSQSITGDLGITVTDPNGGTVPGATLDLTNTREGTTLGAKANDLGTYTFQPAEAGHIQPQSHCAGFQEQRVSEINIPVSPAHLDRRQTHRWPSQSGRRGIGERGNAAQHGDCDRRTGNAGTLDPKPAFKWPKLHSTCTAVGRCNTDRIGELSCFNMDRSLRSNHLDSRFARE